MSSPELRAPSQQLREQLVASKRTARLVRSLNLDSCQMPGEDLEGIGLEEASAVEANFETAELRESRFLDCDFTRAKFSEATLCDSRFHSCGASAADFRRADLSGVLFQSSVAYDADFEAARMTGANLDGSSMDRASFRDADLRHVKASFARFNGANLTGADLSGGFFERSDFRGALLDGALWTGAEIVECLFDTAPKSVGSP